MIPLDPIPRPIDHVLQGAATDVALADRHGTLSFAGLEELVGQVAAWLARCGLPAGARVASWLPKTRLACVLPLAAPRAGLVHVPVNPVLKRRQLAHILDDSGAALLVTQAARWDGLEPGDVPAGCRTVLDDEVTSSDVMPPSAAAPDVLAALLYTSGSTGRAKGVMLSHANLWLGAVSVAHYLQLTPEDRVLAAMPLAFDYGQNQLLSGWLAGGGIVPLDYAMPQDVVRAVARHRITTLAGVPPLWVHLLEAEWPAETAALLRRLTNTGGALTRPMVAGLRGRFPQADLIAMYGLTEAFRSTWLPPALIDLHPESIGRAVPFAELMIVREDGAAAGPEEPGELVHAGPLVAQGYWRDPERTAARFRPPPAWSDAAGPAVWSGDRVVADAQGLLRFVGRADETIKTAGNRVSPGEVEEAVLAGGETAQAIAIGVPDSRLGQAIVVVAAGDGRGEAALRARLRAELPSFQQPQHYLWRPQLPTNANGKLDRAAIRQEVLA